MVNEKVERWIASEAYREHNLTVAIVARQMGLPQRQLQEWLRQSEYGKLAGLVTTLRIEEAKRVLKQHPRQLSVIDRDLDEYSVSLSFCFELFA